MRETLDIQPTDNQAKVYVEFAAYIACCIALFFAFSHMKAPYNFLLFWVSVIVVAQVTAHFSGRSGQTRSKNAEEQEADIVRAVKFFLKLFVPMILFLSFAGWWLWDTFTDLKGTQFYHAYFSGICSFAAKYILLIDRYTEFLLKSQSPYRALAVRSVLSLNWFGIGILYIFIAYWVPKFVNFKYVMQVSCEIKQEMPTFKRALYLALALFAVRLFYAISFGIEGLSLDARGGLHIPLHSSISMFIFLPWTAVLFMLILFSNMFIGLVMATSFVCQKTESVE